MNSVVEPSVLWLIVGLLLLAALISARVLLKKKEPALSEPTKDTEVPAEVAAEEPKTSQALVEVAAADLPVDTKAQSETPSPVIVPSSIPNAQEELKSALASTQKSLFGRLKDLFKGSTELTLEAHWDELEETLLTADLGPKTAQDLLNSLQEKKGLKGFEELKSALGDELRKRIEQTQEILNKKSLNIIPKPLVIMIVGVNGAGKTTSIGKLAAHFKSKNLKVLVVAADTFRAAAHNQLKEWVDRAQVDFFMNDNTKDPAAVAYQGLEKGKDYDLILVDTAGRLHTQAHLMEELKKVKRICDKAIAGTPHETWIVLDANSGQNALEQARQFHSALGLTGAVVTKLDGTAKGGVVVGLANELKIPIQFIGVGEKIHQLRPFVTKEFCEALDLGS